MENNESNNTNQENKITEIKKKKLIRHKRTENSKYYYGTLGEKFFYADKVIADLIEQPDFQQQMSKFGYTMQKIEEFTAVYQAAHSARSKHSSATLKKNLSYDEFAKLYDSALNEFRLIIKVAKIALRGYLELRDKLKLSAKRGRTINDYFAFMDSFYSQTLADSEILSRMNLFGYPQELIVSSQKLYLDAKAAQQIYHAATASANEAGREQKQKIAVMDEWMSEYYALLKVATAQEDLRRKLKMDGNGDV